MCPCDSGNEFDDCCGRFYAGLRHATTAEELMRSRYTAFVREDADYLARTWHPDTCPEHINVRKGYRWTGLEIISTHLGGPFDLTGSVEFAASYQGGSLREKSQFVRVDGRWVYVDEQ